MQPIVDTITRYLDLKVNTFLTKEKLQPRNIFIYKNMKSKLNLEFTSFYPDEENSIGLAYSSGF